MTRWSRLALAAVAVVLAVVLFLVLRPGDDEDGTDATPAAQTTTGDTTTEASETETETETGETTTEETTTEADPNAPRRIELVVRGGQPVGGVRRPEIERDQRVVIVVRSDVTDHIHLHGYDLLADVAPGQPGRISFRADTQGRFELELEDRAVVLAELEVR